MQTLVFLCLSPELADSFGRPHAQLPLLTGDVPQLRGGERAGQPQVRLAVAAALQAPGSAGLCVSVGRASGEAAVLEAPCLQGGHSGTRELPDGRVLRPHLHRAASDTRGVGPGAAVRRAPLVFPMRPSVPESQRPPPGVRASPSGPSFQIKSGRVIRSFLRPLHWGLG